jgi:Polyketide cyclase / dehydrase and lipid transport
MGSITKEIDVGASAADVWDALRDFGAVHLRVLPGFVVECETEENERVVTFASGVVLRERLITIDDARRRFVYTVVESPLDLVHHQGSVEALADPGENGCRVVWTTDFLPEEIGPIVESLMSEGAAVMERTFAAAGASA